MRNTCGSLMLLLVAIGLTQSRAIAQPETNAVRALSIEKTAFGTTQNGESVDLYLLRNTNGVTARVMTYGAIIYSLETPDRHDRFANITANRETLADYQKRSGAFGSLIGRYANRIAKGSFALDGQSYSLLCNGGPNHLHGGARGFDKRVWRAEVSRSCC